MWGWDLTSSILSPVSFMPFLVFGGYQKHHHYVMKAFGVVVGFEIASVGKMTIVLSNLKELLFGLFSFVCLFVCLSVRPCVSRSVFVSV